MPETDKIHRSDVAIILGSKVNPDGTLSQRLAARLNKGIQLYQQELRCNISPLYTAHANYFEWRDIYSIVREIAGLYYYWIKYPACV
ncbi:hypothetical protein [Legionella cardiaca]|uniref:Uncharacterized protein n=1 Tax=Legionella cardiaca TaxID=1071983 RepID=A0ABY8ATR3_9GAMM|nr:hypothetical protein [Legionella cardiaca]WED44059.1 hypothetical protein PXX05_04535 [Legionella cardiaca]